METNKVPKRPLRPGEIRVAMKSNPGEVRIVTSERDRQRLIRLDTMILRGQAIESRLPQEQRTLSPVSSPAPDLLPASASGTLTHCTCCKLSSGLTNFVNAVRLAFKRKTTKRALDQTLHSR